MSDANEYTDLIAGYHATSEKYCQWVYELTEPVRTAREKISGFISDYDIDYAVGNQLDAVGVRVGQSRKLETKISDVFFGFDDVDCKGFDLGIWKTPRDSANEITELSDEIYRIVLKAKVALNQYRGDNESIADLITKVMSAFNVNSSEFSYVDNQDMTISVYIHRSVVPPIVWKLFYNGTFSLNHAGVKLNLVDGVYGALATTASQPMTTDNEDYLMMEY